MDVYKDGGYGIEYHKYGDCYPGYIAFEEYATKAEALKGIKELNGFLYKIIEFPGNYMYGKEITIADLEAPENE